jgi:hypothetical protein
MGKIYKLCSMFEDGSKHRTYYLNGKQIYDEKRISALEKLFDESNILFEEVDSWFHRVEVWFKKLENFFRRFK